MSELLGEAVLELDIDQKPLVRGMADTKAKTVAFVAQEQAILDKLVAHYAKIGTAAQASGDEQAMASKEVADAYERTAKIAIVTGEAQEAIANRVTAALEREAAAAKLAGDEAAAAAVKGAAADAAAGRRQSSSTQGSSADRALLIAAERVAAAAGQRQAPGSGTTHVAGEPVLYGVRGPARAGSLSNPIVAVIEAGRYAPMGAMAASSDYGSAGQNTGAGQDLATSADLGALAEQVTQMARSLTSVGQLADAVGASTAPGGPPGPAQIVHDPEGALLLGEIGQRLSALEKGIAQRLAVTPERIAAEAAKAPPGPRASRSAQPIVIDTSRTTVEEKAGGPPVAASAPGRPITIVAAPSPQQARYSQALDRQQQAQTAANQARRAYNTASRATADTTHDEQVVLLAAREAAAAELAAAKAETKAAQAQITAAAGGAGKPPGGRPPIALGGSGGGGGSRNIWTPGGGFRNVPDRGGSPFSGANLLKGDGGRGGALGLPGFGSIGSLAGLGLEHIILSGLGIGASAGSAVAGAGLLGASSLTQGLVGGGADALISHDTVKQAQALYTNVQALNKAVAVYGANSKQAAAAQYNLNQQWKELGGGAGKQAIQQLDANYIKLKQTFDAESGGARVQAANIDEQILKLAQTYTPLVVQAAQRNLGIINTGLKPLFSWLEGPQGIGIFHDLENAFAKNLPTSIHALSMGIEDFLRLMDAASSSTGGLTKTIDNFLTKKNAESVSQYDAEVAKLVGDLHLWTKLLKVLGEDLVGVFKADAGTAPAIVTELTNMLQKLHEWEQSTRGQSQLQNIFEVHKQEIQQLLQLLPTLLHGYGSFYLEVAPTLVKAVTGIAHAFVAVANAIAQVPGGAALEGLALVLGRLGVLGPAIRGLGGALGLLTAAEAKNVVPSAADALALTAEEGALVGGAGAGAAETAGGAGLLSRLMPGAMLAAVGGKAAGAAEGAGIGGLAAGGIGVGAMAAGAGGLGFLGGDLVSSLLGAHGAVSDALKGAGAGAGIGTVIAPGIGTAIGAAVGAGLGAAMSLFDSHAPDYGQKFAKGFVAPFADRLTATTAQALTKKVADAADAAKQAQQEQHDIANAPTSPRGGPLVTPAAGEKDAIAKWNAFGVASGQAFDAGLNTKNLSVTDADYLIQGFIGQLNKLPPQARQAAAQTMVQFTAQVFAGRPGAKGAVEAVIQSLQQQFPSLTLTAKNTAKQTADALTTAFQFRTAGTTLRTTLVGFQQQFNISQNGAFQSTKGMVSNINSTYSSMQDHLYAISAGLANHIPGYTKQMATGSLQAIHQLQTQSDQYFTAMAAHAGAQIASMSSQIQAGSATARDQASGDFQQLASNINSAMASGALSVGKGTQLIADALNTALKAFGEQPLSIPTIAAATPGQLGAVASGTVSSGGLASPHAAGGLIQIGRPGEAGRDSVPLNVGGTPIMVAPGEQVAVFNRHQLPIVNAALGGMGGLPGLFSSVSTPNYMASGGLVPGFAGGGTFSYGQLEGLWDQAGGAPGAAALMAAIAEAESGGNPSAQNPSGATGLWQILGDPFPGNAFDPLTNARMAVAKYAGGSGLGAWVTYTDGAYKQFLQGGVPASASGASGGGGGGVQQHTTPIGAPTVSGGGTIGQIAQGALNLIAKGATAYEQKHAPLTPAGGGGSVGSGVGAAVAGSGTASGLYSPADLGTFDGLPVADWIIPELVWARAHGWAGSVTSGWRSPSQVVQGVFATAPQGQSEHQYDIYPGGAVDVSDYQQFAQIIAGYPGADKLIQLGIDPLHFSGTGHARGGLVQMLAAGGLLKGYDATGGTLASIPKDAQWWASYLDNYGGYAQGKSLFPHIPGVSLSVTPGNNIAADMYDVEPKGKTVAETIAAIRAGRAKGAYGGADDLAAIRSGVGHPFPEWVAAWPGSGSYLGAAVGPYGAHQYASGSAYDSDVATPAFLSALGLSGGTPSPGDSSGKTSLGKGAHGSKKPKKPPKPLSGHPLAGGITGPSAFGSAQPGTLAPYPFDSSTDLKSINAALSAIFSLDGGQGGTLGGGGDAQHMSDLITYYTNLWSSALYPSPNFGNYASPGDFAITTDPQGNPVTPFLSPHITEVGGELSQIIGWQQEWVGDLSTADVLSLNVKGPIQKAIQARVQAVAQIKQMIAENLKAIAALKKKIADAKKQLAGITKAGTPNQQTLTGLNNQVTALGNKKTQLLDSLYKGNPTKAQKASINSQISAIDTQVTALNTKIAAEQGKSPNKSQMGPINKQIGAWNGQISQYEAQNNDLSGSPTSVGTGGELGTITGQLGVPGSLGGILLTEGGTSSSGLYGLQDTVAGWDSQLTSVNGDIPQQQLQLQLYQAALAGLLPGAQAQLAADNSQAGGTAATNSTLVSLLQQQNTLLAEEYAVSQDQYGALKSLNYAPLPGLAGGGMLDFSSLGSLPPFGGFFETGGIVPGPVGAARTAIVHGGEVVTPVGGGAPVVHHVIVEDGAVDPNKIRVIAHAEVQKQGRADARVVRRKLPGRGGGVLVAGRY